MEESKDAEQARLGCDQYEKEGLYDLNQEKVGGSHKDYHGAIHHKVLSTVDKQPIQLNKVLAEKKKDFNPEDTFSICANIKFGHTKISEYDVIETLGKGTYGEVHKCIHKPTGSVVALKTFLFEVSYLLLTLKECLKWHQLLLNERNQSAKEYHSIPQLR